MSRELWALTGVPSGHDLCFIDAFSTSPAEPA